MLGMFLARECNTDNAMLEKADYFMYFQSTLLK